MKRLLWFVAPMFLGAGIAAPALADRAPADVARYGLSCSPAEILEPASWVSVPLSSEEIDWAKAGDNRLACISAPPGQTARLRGFQHASTHNYTDIMLFTNHGRRKLLLAHVAPSGNIDLQDVVLVSALPDQDVAHR